MLKMSKKYLQRKFFNFEGPWENFQQKLPDFSENFEIQIPNTWENLKQPKIVFACIYCRILQQICIFVSLL